MKARPKRAEGRGRARAAPGDPYTQCVRQQVRQTATRTLSKAATKLKVALDCLATAGGDNSTEGGEGSSAGEEDDGAWPTEWLGHGGTGLAPADPIQAAVYASYAEEGARLDAQSTSAPSGSSDRPPSPAPGKAGPHRGTRSAGHAASDQGSRAGSYWSRAGGRSKDPLRAAARWSATVRQEKALVDAILEEDRLFYGTLVAVLAVPPVAARYPTTEDPPAFPAPQLSQQRLRPAADVGLQTGEFSQPFGDRVVAGFRSTSSLKSGLPPLNAAKDHLQNRTTSTSPVVKKL